MKRRVLVVLCLVVFCAATAAFADEGPANRPVLQDGKTGFVGIGTGIPQTALDVYHGEVRLGSSGVNCTAQIAGAMRSADNKLQFCDGAGWRNVSLDKAQ